MSENKIDEKLLNFDALDAAEVVTGKSYKDDEKTANMGLFLHAAAGKAKAEMLTAAGDTSLRNGLADYLRIIAAEGFEQMLRLPFTAKGYRDEPDRAEELHVHYHRADGILLVFDTYRTNGVNGGHFFYNWRRKEGGSFGVVSSGHGRPDGIWAGHHDCREALRYHIRRLREEGSFVTPWVERPFLWLLHHGDTKVEGYNYKAINAERIAMLPEDVRAALGPER